MTYFAGLDVSLEETAIWTLLRTSRFYAASDSLRFVGQETNRWAGSRGFSTSMSGCGV